MNWQQQQQSSTLEENNVNKTIKQRHQKKSVWPLMTYFTQQNSTKLPTFTIYTAQDVS